MNQLQSSSDFSNALIKLYNIIPKNINKFDIVYSITFHESSLCMLDTLLNIMTYNHLNNILIICSINTNVNNEISKLKLPPNIIIHPEMRHPNTPMLWNTNLFICHMKNYQYLLNNNISFDYFCTLASNEMFIRPVDINIVKNNICLVEKQFVPKSPDQILDKLTTWVHYKPFMYNIDMCKFFLNNGYEPFAMYHEGLILPSSIIYDVYQLFIKDNFNQKITGLQNFLLEEVFIPTYLHNHFNYNNYSLTYRNFDNPCISENEIKEAENKFYSVKRIPRIFNNNIRVMIREKYMQYIDQEIKLVL